MKMVVGLGNPGEKYEKTRHNIGAMVVKRLAEELGASLKQKKVVFLLPQTFMNRSGEAVREAKNFYRIADGDLLVIHDDLDLPLGKVKLDFEAGSAGHRGVSSLIEELGTKSFHRVRMGIGRPQAKEDVERYVLTPFDPKDEKVVQEMIGQATEMTKTWIGQEVS